MALPPELLDPRMALYWASVPLQVALAVVTLALAPGDARHRAFAVLVACNAAWDFTEGLAFAAAGSPAVAQGYTRAEDHFAVWTAFALAAFLCVYPTQRRFARVALPALALGAAATSIALVADRSLYAEGGAFGPLRLALLGWYPLLAVGAALILRDAARGAHERAFPRALVAAALLVYPLGTLVLVLDPAFWSGFVPSLAPMLASADGWPQAIVAYASLAAVLVAPLLALWAAATAARSSRGMAAFLVVALASLVVLDLVPGAPLRWPGATSLVFAALTAYALARGQLFDIDLRLKWTLSRGTVVGAFLTVGILVAEVVAQQVVSDRLGATAGVLAAGLLFFAFKPLKRLADRLANLVMPKVQDTPDYLEKRKREVYLAAVEGAFADGLMTERERRVLDRLGAKLGLEPAEMARLEQRFLDERA